MYGSFHQETKIEIQLCYMTISKYLTFITHRIRVIIPSLLVAHLKYFMVSVDLGTTKMLVVSYARDCICQG